MKTLCKGLGGPLMCQGCLVMSENFSHSHPFHKLRILSRFKPAELAHTIFYFISPFSLQIVQSSVLQLQSAYIYVLLRQVTRSTKSTSAKSPSPRQYMKINSKKYWQGGINCGISSPCKFFIVIGSNFKNHIFATKSTVLFSSAHRLSLSRPETWMKIYII